MDKELLRKRVVYINDLVKENVHLCSQDEFERMYNAKTNLIQFQGMINAIKDYARKHNFLHFTRKL